MATGVGQADAALTEEPLRTAFERHYSSLINLCLLVTGHRQTAEDITQEAFVRVARRLSTIDRDAWGPYLRRTALNIWKNQIRRMAADVRLQVRLRSNLSDHLPDDAHLEVWDVVRQLPFRQRACVVLRFYVGLSEHEVAEALGCSDGTVKTHTSRAMAKLRGALENET